MVLADVGQNVPAFLVEVGLIAVGLAILARVAARLGVSAIPLFLVAGLPLGRGGVVGFGPSEEFVTFGAEIGVLLLLLTLGLEYTGDELKAGLRTGTAPGLVDAALNFTPGLLLGLLLGWEPVAAVLLGGVTWGSSSGVISKVLTELDRLGNRETPAVLNLLVVEDLAMALYLPIVAAILAGENAARTALIVTAALVTVGIVLWLAMSWGHLISIALYPANNEALVLAVVGMALLLGGLLQTIQVSAAIGAFLVGLAIGGHVQERATTLVEPLRDVFAAIFFLFFASRIDPAELPGALLPAIVLLLLTAVGKIVTGWFAAGRIGVGSKGRMRAGTALIARGEFSIVIAAMGATLVDGAALGNVAAAYVLLTAIIGPIAAKNSKAISSLIERRAKSPASA